MMVEYRRVSFLRDFIFICSIGFNIGFLVALMFL